MEVQRTDTWVKVPATMTQVADDPLCEIDETTPPEILMEGELQTDHKSKGQS